MQRVRLGSGRYVLAHYDRADLQRDCKTPGINERALIVWFQSSDHATMPNLILAQKDLDDVVAYILSLRAHK